jgi:acyl-CoA reductase-like NAD-dependent aldehyde dehydrogenase
VLNPATEAVVAQCPNATQAHLDAAVRAARKAFPAWSNAPESQRKAKVIALADLLAKHRDEVHRKPLGVVASITPWNFPVMIAIWHVIPALFSGNTVVIKPSSYTPLATLRFVELAQQILPAGVLNSVTGEAIMGRLIAAHPQINKIVFTGSTPTGKNIMKNAAGSLKRLYVHEAIYDEMCEELTDIAKSISVGNGLEEGVQLGPIQNKRQLNIVRELVADAKKAGAQCCPLLNTPMWKRCCKELTTAPTDLAAQFGLMTLTSRLI